MNSKEPTASGVNSLTDTGSTYQQPEAPASADERPRASDPIPRMAVLPALYLVLLLLLATWWQGAFELRHCTPLPLFGMVALVALTGMGGVRVTSRPAGIALAALWGFVAWGLLSAIWSGSRGAAIEDAARASFYAAIFTVIFLTLRDRRSAAAIGRYVVAGLGLIAVYTLIRLHVNGDEFFLAGRLNGPVNYRNGTAC